MAPATLMKTEERRNGVRGTEYTEEEGVSLRLAIRNLWFDSKDFGFMRFEGSFQKENQMYQWKVHANSVNNKTTGITNRISSTIIFPNFPVCTVLLLRIKHGRLRFIHFWSLVLCCFYPGILFMLFLPFTQTFIWMMFCAFGRSALHLIYLTMIYHKIFDLILGIELLKSLTLPLIKTVKMGIYHVQS